MKAILFSELSLMFNINFKIIEDMLNAIVYLLNFDLSYSFGYQFIKRPLFPLHHVLQSPLLDFVLKHCEDKFNKVIHRRIRWRKDGIYVKVIIEFQDIFPHMNSEIIHVKHHRLLPVDPFELVEELHELVTINRTFEKLEMSCSFIVCYSRKQSCTLDVKLAHWQNYVLVFRCEITPTISLSGEHALIQVIYREAILHFHEKVFFCLYNTLIDSPFKLFRHNFLENHSLSFDAIPFVYLA